MSRVAIVTGASSGIGAAIARELGRRGWRVVVNYASSREEAEQVAAGCGEAVAVRADVGEDAECRALAQAALDRWGRIDGLVNNAGTTKHVPHAELENLSAEDFLRIYRLNVVAPFQMARACAAALREARGAVVNVSSVASLRGTGSSIAYAASKSALNTLTLSLARVLAPEVRVNAVLPGYTDTPWQRKALGEAGAAAAAERYAGMVPLKSAVRPEDVADAAAWLLEGARMTTGEALFIDGGMHMAGPR